MSGEIEKRNIKVVLKVVQCERVPGSIVHINGRSRKFGGEWGEATQKRGVSSDSEGPNKGRQQQRTTVFFFLLTSLDGAVPGRLATNSPRHRHHQVSSLLIPRRDSRCGPIQHRYVRRTQQQQDQRPRTTKMSLRRMCYCCFSSPVTVPAGA